MSVSPLAPTVATLWMPRSSSGWCVTRRSAPASTASLTTASVGSTARCTRRTGWSRSPATSPTWSQSIAVSGGYTDSSAATTSRSVSGSSKDTSRQCHTPVGRALYGGRMEPQPPNTARPRSVSDETVEALGKLSEALEVVENRGYLYAFHRLTGMG